MWENARISERKGNSGIATIKVDWVVDSEVVFTYSDIIDTVTERVKFRTEANAAKDKYITRSGRQDTLSAQIETFMNN